MTHNEAQSKYSLAVIFIKEMVGHEYLYLPTAIEVKMTPHSSPFSIWGLSVSPDMELFVMDNEEQWHKVEETDSAIIGSIYQRVAQLHKQHLTA